MKPVGRNQLLILLTIHIEPLMNKPKRGKQPLNLTDNAQCRCFEKPTTSQHYFFLKNIYPKDINQTPFNRTQQNMHKIELMQSNSKKSLRKQKSREHQKQHNTTKRLTIQDYYPPSYKQIRTERVDFRQPPPQIKERSIQYRTSFRENYIPNNQFQSRSPLLVKSASAQFISTPISFTQKMIPSLSIKEIQMVQARVLSPPVSPRMYASSEKTIYQSGPITPRYKMQNVLSSTVKSPVKLKQQMWTQPQPIQEIQSQNYPKIKICQEKNTKETKSHQITTIKSKVFDIGSKQKGQQMQFKQKKKLGEQLSFYKEQPLKPKMVQEQIKSKIFFDKSRLNIPSFESIIDTNRSRIDDGTGKSKITLKKAKNQKARLKKMQDVQEIKSMIDSDEMMSDNDKQSVVLGRLHEFGSVVDQPFSAFNSRPITFMSKAAYQSTTAEKSMVK